MKSSALALVLALPLVSTIASADPMGWLLVSSSADSASSPQEFAGLQQKYPQYLGGFDSAGVSSADISFATFQFVGTTTCPANDPRLTFTGVSYDVCYASVGGCSTSMYVMPKIADPCA